MEREVPRRAHQRRRRPRQLEPARRQIEPRVVRVLGEQPVDRDVVAVPRNPAGHLADLARGAAVHLGHFAQRAAELEGVVVRHHRGAGHRVAAEHPGEDVVPLVPGEVEVDVGRVLPLRVEKALEQEPGAEWLHVGDAERVAHDRVGHRAPAAVGGSVLDDVLDHQEVVGEALHPDDGELVLEPGPGDRRDGAVTPRRARVGQRAQLGLGVLRFGVSGRHDPVTDRNPVAAPLGQLAGAVERVGYVGKVAGELVGGFEPRFAGGRADRRTVLRQRGVIRDRHQQPVPGPVLRMREPGRVGDHRRDAEPARRGEHRVASRAGRELRVHVARARARDDPLEERDAGGEKEQGIAVAGEQGGKTDERTEGRKDGRWGEGREGRGSRSERQ